MRKCFPILLAILLTAIASVATAQVKQIFKIMEYPTNRPLAGAACTYYGQTITSNAKGVAVLNLSADRKGDFIPREPWILDQYTYLGRNGFESNNQYFQSRDTIRLYMMKTSDYDAEVLGLFKKYFDFAYHTAAQTMLAFNDSLAKHPERDEHYAQHLMNSATESYYQLVDDAFFDAASTHPNRLSLYSPDIQKGITEILRSGDVNRAVATAKAQILPNDTSFANLQRIAFYLTLRDLKLATQDTQSTVDYKKRLYEQHYSIKSTSNYIYSLLDEGRYDEAEAVARKEKANPYLPSEEYIYHPIPNKFLDKDEDSLRAGFLHQNQVFLEIYRRYPSIDMMEELAWDYSLMSLIHQYLSDTISAHNALDSAMILYHKSSEAHHLSQKHHNQQLIGIYTNMLKNYMTSEFSPKIDSLRRVLISEIWQMTKENYEQEPDNLFLQLQYAARANPYIDMLSERDDQDSLRKVAIRDLSALIDILVPKYPEAFTVENMVTKSRLLGTDLNDGADEATLRSSFRKFKETYSAVNSLYPDIFTSTYLSFVSAIGEAAKNQQYNQLAADIHLFVDELLHQTAQKAGKSFDVQKALFLNDQAEDYYQQQQYATAISYYEQANEYFQKAIAQDPTLWTPFLRNFLQMGDAYLYQGKFEEALNTYRKVLSYENQIPADQAASYTGLKGNVSYYEGDLWGETGDVKSAEKCYKQAEKLFRKAIQMGDSSAYHSLGEMYLVKAIRQYKQGNMKNIYPLTEQSVQYYESYPINRPLQRYVQAKSIMEDYYWNKKDSIRYTNNLRGFADYYHRFAEYDTFYVNKSILYTGKYLRYNLSPEEELLYNRNIVTDYERILPMTGLTLPYLQRNFQLAKAYRAMDSTQQAIDIFNKCLKLNTEMYRDTALNKCLSNETDIYKALIECNSAMAEQYEDEEGLSQEWYGKALDASDTLILIMERLRKDGDADQTYQLGLQYYRNAILCTQTDWNSIALGQLDKSNSLLIGLYNDKYASETEFEIIRNYYVKGLIAEDMNNSTLAKECYQAAVSYAEKASDPVGVALLYNAVITNWLTILENQDGGKDAATIAKLKQTKASLSKIVKKR